MLSSFGPRPTAAFSAPTGKGLPFFVPVRLRAIRIMPLKYSPDTVRLGLTLRSCGIASTYPLPGFRLPPGRP